MLKIVPEQHLSMEVGTRVGGRNYFMGREAKAPDPKVFSLKKSLEENLVPIIIEALQKDQPLIIPRP